MLFIWPRVNLFLRFAEMKSNPSWFYDLFITIASCNWFSFSLFFSLSALNEPLIDWKDKSQSRFSDISLCAFHLYCEMLYCIIFCIWNNIYVFLIKLDKMKTVILLYGKGFKWQRKLYLHCNKINEKIICSTLLRCIGYQS